MPSQKKEKILAEKTSGITINQLFWRYEDEPIIVELPDELIHTNKIRVLEPFIREFKRNVAYQSKILAIKEFIVPFLSKIKQVDSVFVSFSEERSKIEVIILLTNKRYDRGLAKMLFEIKLALEEKYTECQVEFLEIPRFDRKEEDIVSKTFIKIFP